MRGPYSGMVNGNHTRLMPGSGTWVMPMSGIRKPQRQCPRVAGTPCAVQCCAPTPARFASHAATLPIATRAPCSPSPRLCSRASPASPPPLLTPPFAASSDPRTDHLAHSANHRCLSRFLPRIGLRVSVSPKKDWLLRRVNECRGREFREIADAGTRVGVFERRRDFLAGHVCVSSCSLSIF